MKALSHEDHYRVSDAQVFNITGKADSGFTSDLFDKGCDTHQRMS
jgi:hypothetical protein